jgi:hypothetical protein
LDTVKFEGSDDPRPRRGDRGGGFARARKQSQAVIVGGVSLEAVPAAREDDAETASKGSMSTVIAAALRCR